MTKTQNSTELFEIIGKDPLSWLTQAKEMKMVADLILPVLQNEFSFPPTFPGTQGKRLAYIGSYFLFLGLAFENLIKGILIGRDPTLVTKDTINNGILGRKGHGITEGAKRIINLTQQELELVGRIEEYLFWAGRYPLPLHLNIFLNSESKKLRSFISNDPLSVEKIFEKLVIVLENERSETNYP